MRLDSAPAIRVIAFIAILAGLLVPTSAFAISIMDPFNVGPAMDTGAVKIGDGVSYGPGARDKLDVYVPKNPKGTAPVLFFIYGGGWDHGDRADYQFVGRAFASRGFVVVIADYRLYPQVKYPDFLEDNARALKWVQDNIANYGGDTDRLFLAGHSAGAYNAVMLAVDQSFFHDQGVTMTIKGVAAISGPYDFYPFEYDEVRNSFGSALNPEGTQPVNLVTSDDPPMFLCAGTHDPIVRIQNSQALAAKLRAQGDWVTEKYYDGFGHMEPVLAIGALWRWRAPVLDDIVTFFQRFGAFPGGVPRVPEEPAAPGSDDQQQMQNVIAKLDSVMEPIGGGRRNE
ncbi:MAG TPA: alpha/beta hydrolase [Devosiaceae bacterium]|nr:alpha/beta hydrolase [Devosiaceae bacterium]